MASSCLPFFDLHVAEVVQSVELDSPSINVAKEYQNVKAPFSLIYQEINSLQRMSLTIYMYTVCVATQRLRL